MTPRSRRLASLPGSRDGQQRQGRAGRERHCRRPRGLKRPRQPPRVEARARLAACACSAPWRDSVTATSVASAGGRPRARRPRPARAAPPGVARSSRSSRRMSARSASRCELTETYSPAAIDSAPATSPAVPAVTIAPPTRRTPRRPARGSPSTRCRHWRRAPRRAASWSGSSGGPLESTTRHGAPLSLDRLAAATAYGAQWSVAAASSPAGTRSTPPRREEPTTMSPAPLALGDGAQCVSGRAVGEDDYARPVAPARASSASTRIRTSSWISGAAVPAGRSMSSPPSGRVQQRGEGRRIATGLATVDADDDAGEHRGPSLEGKSSTSR